MTKFSPDKIVDYAFTIALAIFMIGGAVHFVVNL